jgi:hypothetical protein
MLSIPPLTFVEALVVMTMTQKSNMTDEPSETMAIEDPPKVGLFHRAVAFVDVVVTS